MFSKFCRTADSTEACIENPTLLDSKPSGGKLHCEIATVSATSSAANDLQEWFEVLPSHDQVGWLGGDSDVSVVIEGGPTGKRALWIFADTFVSKYGSLTQSRILEGNVMPNSTVAIVNLEVNGKAETPRFYWRSGSSGEPVSFFELPQEQTDDGQLIWPVSGTSSQCGRSVVLLAQRIKGFLNVIGTTVIVIPDATVEDPRDWVYNTYGIGSATLVWFSSIFFPVAGKDEVYIFGHAGTQEFPPSQNSETILARSTFGRLLDGDWESTEYWVQSGRWSQEAAVFKPIGLPSWETTCNWSTELGLWYSFYIEPFGSQVFVCTAESVTGQWATTKVFNIPEPFTKGPWINYAAKSHPELRRANQGGNANEAELIFTFVSNVLEDTEAQSSGSTLFGLGQMQPYRRGYWPRFVRVIAKREV